MIYVLFLIYLPFFGILCFSIVSILAHRDAMKEVKEFPMVSILLAARNEEALILRSLHALDALDYPEDRIEILIGDDQSTDKTAALVEGYIHDKSKFKLFTIASTLGKGRGKANVLAHLAHEAKGEYYFITDVDVKPSTQWIKGHIAQFKPEVGIVSGTTKCERKAGFATLQAMDWLHFMGYIKAFANVGVACTSVGNNMAVRAEAYWQTGGFENIDFSITEDYKLFEAVTQNGWNWSAALNPQTLGLAWYIPSIKEMLHQRKRWLIGARDLPLKWKVMIVLYGLFIPALVLTFFVSVKLALVVWGAKFLLQTLFISFLCMEVERKQFRLSQFVMYEVYVMINTLASALFYWLPIRSVWKGREYNAAYLRDV